MSFKQRYNLAVEESDILDNVEASELSVNDVIENATIDSKMTKIESEIEEDKVAIEEAESALDNITEQLQDNENMIEEAPEQITDEVVTASVESHYDTMSKLGLELKEYKVSFESCSTPMEKLVEHNRVLRISQEGIVDGIKSIIGHMTNNVDSYTELFLKKSTARAKVIAGLKANIKNLDNGYIPGSGSINSAVRHVGTYVGANNGKYDIKLFSSYVSDDPTNAGGEVMEKISKSLAAMARSGNNQIEKEILDAIVNSKRAKHPLSSKLSNYLTIHGKKAFFGKRPAEMSTVIAIPEDGRLCCLYMDKAYLDGKMSMISRIFSFLNTISLNPIGYLFWKWIGNLFATTSKTVNITTIKVPNSDVTCSNKFNKSELVSIIGELEKLNSNTSQFYNKLKTNYDVIVKNYNNRFIGGKITGELGWTKGGLDEAAFNHFLRRAMSLTTNVHYQNVKQYNSFINDSVKMINTLV